MTINHRLASEIGPDFPYESERVCWIEMAHWVPNQLHDTDDKRKALRRAIAGTTLIYAVWPRKWQSDLFLLDDLDAAAKALDAAS